MTATSVFSSLQNSLTSFIIYVLLVLLEKYSLERRTELWTVKLVKYNNNSSTISLMNFLSAKTLLTAYRLCICYTVHEVVLGLAKFVGNQRFNYGTPQYILHYLLAVQLFQFKETTQRSENLHF